MADEPKRRAPTWDDVREAHQSGWDHGYECAEHEFGPGCEHYGCEDDAWTDMGTAPWHPDNPANHIAEPEWRTDAPEVGTVIECRDGRRWFVSSEYWAETVEGDAQKSPGTDAWRYIDPPTDTTSEDNE